MSSDALPIYSKFFFLMWHNKLNSKLFSTSCCAPATCECFFFFFPLNIFFPLLGLFLHWVNLLNYRRDKKTRRRFLFMTQISQSGFSGVKGGFKLFELFFLSIGCKGWKNGLRIKQFWFCQVKGILDCSLTLWFDL